LVEGGEEGGGRRREEGGGVREVRLEEEVEG
jgi:hypothetical protein